MTRYRLVMTTMLAGIVVSLLAVFPAHQSIHQTQTADRHALSGLGSSAVEIRPGETSAPSTCASTAAMCVPPDPSALDAGAIGHGTPGPEGDGGAVIHACSAEANTARRVSDTPPSMLHLDPRRTNRSAWEGPREPKLAWTFDTGGPVESAPALLEDGTIVVTSLGGTLHGVRPDGTSRFRVEFGNRLYSSPLVLHDVLFAGVDGGKFVGLGLDGTVRWRVETDGDADTGATSTAWGAVVFASGRQVYAVRPNGTIVWRVKARRKVFSSPAVGDDGTVFFGSQDHHVYAVSPEGKVVWRVNVGADVDCAPAIGDDGTVFIGTDGAEVIAMGPADGSIRWRTRVGGFVRGSLSVRRDGSVLAGTYGPRPHVVALSPDTGAQRFDFTVRGTGAREFGIHGSPVEDASGRLYFGAQDDSVYALTSDGALLWSQATHGDVDAPVVITPQGLLLAGSDDGKLYAFEEKSH